jgi:hypothetical protein
MNFDSTGKVVMTTPATETWIIRDQGHNLRASPLRETAEMVMLRSEDLESSFSSGRYELMLGGQAYDFIVAGEWPIRPTASKAWPRFWRGWRGWRHRTVRRW